MISGFVEKTAASSIRRSKVCFCFRGWKGAGGVGGDSFQNAECLSGVRRNVINILAEGTFQNLSRERLLTTTSMQEKIPLRILNK